MFYLIITELKCQKDAQGLCSEHALFHRSQALRGEGTCLARLGLRPVRLR